jgi:fructose-1-phosphate kinase PfkB-like protein
MMGALAGSWAQGASFEQAVVVGAAAGAATFLRQGLGSATREVVDELVGAVRVEPLDG